MNRLMGISSNELQMALEIAGRIAMGRYSIQPLSDWCNLCKGAENDINKILSETVLPA